MTHLQHSRHIYTDKSLTLPGLKNKKLKKIQKKTQLCTGLPALPLKASASTLKMDIRALLVWAERQKPVSFPAVLQDGPGSLATGEGGVFCRDLRTCPRGREGGRPYGLENMHGAGGGCRDEEEGVVGT